MAPNAKTTRPALLIMRKNQKDLFSSLSASETDSCVFGVGSRPTFATINAPRRKAETGGNHLQRQGVHRRGRGRLPAR